MANKLKEAINNIKKVTEEAVAQRKQTEPKGTTSGSSNTLERAYDPSGSGNFSANTGGQNYVFSHQPFSKPKDNIDILLETVEDTRQRLLPQTATAFTTEDARREQMGQHWTQVADTKAEEVDRLDREIENIGTELAQRPIEEFFTGYEDISGTELAEQKQLNQSLLAIGESTYNTEMTESAKAALAAIEREEQRRSGAQPDLSAQQEELLRQRDNARQQQKGAEARAADMARGRTVTDDVRDIVSGSLINQAASITGGQRALYEAGQGLRDTMTEIEYQDALRRVERYQIAYDEMTALGYDALPEWNLLQDALADVALYESINGIQRGATKAASDLSRDLQAKGSERIERAKEGKGAVGQLLVDAGAGAVDLLTDITISRLLGGKPIPGAPKEALGGFSTLNMAGRAFGGGAMQAEAAGADINKQVLYGAATATVSVLLEKAIDGVAGAYGKGNTDEVVEALVGKLASTNTGRNIVRSVIKIAGEGGEEYAEAALEEVLMAIYDKGEALRQTYSSPDAFSDAVLDDLYQGLVGAVIGAGAQGVDIAKGEYRAANAELRPQETAPVAPKRAEDILLEAAGVSSDTNTAAESEPVNSPPEPQRTAESAGDIQTPPANAKNNTAETERLNRAETDDEDYDASSYVRNEDSFGFSVRNRGDEVSGDDDFYETGFAPIPPDANVDSNYFYREALKMYGTEAEKFWRANPELSEMPADVPIANKNAWVRAKARDLAYQKAIEIREEIFNIKDDRSIPIAQRLTELMALAEEERSLALIPQKRDWHIVDGEIVDANADSNTAVTGGRGKEYTSIKPAPDGINPRKASAREEPPEKVGARITDEMKDALRGQLGTDIIITSKENGGTTDGRESVQGIAGTGQRGDGVSNAGRTFGTRSRDESKNSRADTAVQGVGNRHQRILQSESHSGGLKPVGGRKEGSISFDKDTREIVNPEGKDREWTEWMNKHTGAKVRLFIGRMFSNGAEKSGAYRSKTKEILVRADTPYTDSTKVHETLHGMFDKARGSRERTAVSAEAYDRYKRSFKAPKVQKAFDEAKAIYYDRNYRARFEDNLSRIDRTKLSEADVFRLVQLAEEDAHARAKEEFLVGVAAISSGLENVKDIKDLSREVRKQLIKDGVVDKDFFTSAPWSDPVAETDSDSDFGEESSSAEVPEFSEDDGPLVFNIDESGDMTVSSLDNALTDTVLKKPLTKKPTGIKTESVKTGTESSVIETAEPEAPPKSAKRQAEETYGHKYEDIQQSVSRVLRSKDFVADKRFKGKVSKATAKAVEDKVSFLKKAITDFGNGLGDINTLSDAYEAAAKDSALSAFVSKQVKAKLDYVKRCYEVALSDESTTYDIKRFQNAADEAMKVVARRFEQANQAMINRLAFEEEAKRNAPKIFKKNIAGKAAGWYASLQMSGPTLFRWVDGFDTEHKGIGYAMAEAAEDSAAVKSIERTKGNKFFSKLSNSKKMDAFLRGETSTGVKFRDVEINQLQAASIISMYTTMKATSKQKFDKLKGFAIPDGKTAKKIEFELEEGESAEAAFGELVSELEAALSDEAREYKGILDDVFAYYNPKLSEVSKDVNGVSNRMFGYGKYFPLRYYKDGEVAEYNLARDLGSESDVDSEGNPIPPKIMLSRSVDSGSFLLIEPVTEVANRYIEQASDYIAYAGFSQRLELMNMSSDIAPGVADTLSENFGEAFGKWMDDYVEDMKLVHDLNKGRDGLGKFAGDTVDALRKNLQQGALLFNPGTPIKQYSAYWTAMGILKPQAMFKALGTNPLGLKKSSIGNSIAADRRLGNIDPTLNELLHSQDTWLGKLKSKSKIISFAADSIGIADSAVVDSLFTATIYDVAMDHPKMDKNSAQFKKIVESKFEELMLTTQSTSARTLGSALQRTKNPWLKITAMFRGQQTQEFNKLIRFAGEYGAASGTTKTAAGRKLRQSIAGQAASYLELALAQLGVNLLLHRRDRYEDEEDKLDFGKIFKSVAIDFAENSAGTAWLGENLAQWIIEETTGENEFYGISLGPISTLKSLVDSLDWFSDKPTLSNLKRVIGNIGNLGGVPANNIFSVVNGVIMNALRLGGSDASEYDDILKYLDAESQRMEIITGKSTAQRLADFIKGNGPSEERQASYDAVELLMDVTGKSSFVPAKPKENLSISHDSVEYDLDSKESAKYYKTSLEVFYDMVDEIVTSPVYSRADADAQVAIMEKLEEYATDSAKSDYFKALGLDYESSFSNEHEGIVVRGRDDNGIAKPDIPAIHKGDLPEYLAMEAAYSSYNRREDYDAVDKILNYLPRLSEAAQQQFRKNTSRSATVSAYEAGVSSGGYEAYKDARSKAMDVYDVDDGTNIAKLYGVVYSGLPQEEMDALAAHVMSVQGKNALKVYNEVRSSGRPITEAMDVYIARHGY